MIDISAVRPDATLIEVTEMAHRAKQYGFIAAFAMPCFTPALVHLLKDAPQTAVGGVVGFPSGADTTLIKTVTARDLCAMGCSEIDMVINVGALKSKQYDFVENDIRSVVEMCDGRPVKSIIEVCYLDNYEIAQASAIAVKAKVAYVKTGTGWGPKPTTVETIKLIKSVIGDSAKIKAAGGIRDLDTVLRMVDAGCSRFGLGLKSAVNIMEEAINALHQ